MYPNASSHGEDPGPPTVAHDSRVRAWALDTLVLAALLVGTLLLLRSPVAALCYSAPVDLLAGWAYAPGLGAQALAALPPPVLRLALVAALLWPLFAVPYYTAFEGLLGRTPGKLVCRYRVAATDTGHRPSLQAAFYRSALRAVDGLLLGFVGAVASLLHPEGKRLGDLLAGTRVEPDPRYRTEDV